MIQRHLKYKYIIPSVFLLAFLLLGCNRISNGLTTPSPMENSSHPTPTGSLQNKFPITIPKNCFFTSVSLNNKWIVMECPINIGGSAGWNIQVSMTSSLNWIPILPVGEGFKYIPASSFSPDDSLLAVVDSYNQRLLIFRVGEWQNYQVVDIPHVHGEPIWSPDSQSIIVNTNGIGDETIAMLVSLNGALQPLLTWNDLFPIEKPNEAMPLPHYGPTWSPDGKKIAYLTYSQRPFWMGDQLWSLDIATGNRILLISGNLGSKPAWSPDGNRVALIDTIPGSDSSQDKSDLVVFDIPTMILKTVMEVTGRYGSNRFDSGIVWSPKSDRLAVFVLRENINDEGLYVVDLTDGATTKIVDYYNAPRPIQWIRENALMVEKFIDNEYVVTLINPFNK